MNSGMVKSTNPAWWVSRWAQLTPNRLALAFGQEEITYAQLAERARRAASALAGMGIEKGDRVAVLMDNRPEFLEVFLACCRLGAIFVPLNFRLTAQELDYLLGHCRPRLLVYSHRFLNTAATLSMSLYRMPPLTAQVGGRIEGQALDYREEVAAGGASVPLPAGSLAPADPEEPQVIMYTSGTTGRPKGAVLSHRKTFFNCLNAEIFFKLHVDDLMLVVLPLFHSGGLFIQSAPCLYKGAGMIIHESFDPAKVLSDIERRRVTKFLGVPYVYRQLLEHPDLAKADLSSLKVCAIGGEKVTPALLSACEKAGFPPRQIMGQTETSILLWAGEAESRARPGTVGRPVFHAEVKLLDKAGREPAAGEVGEIVVRGPVVMKEYWNDPAATEAAMGDGWLKTGDLARRDDEGFFYLVDRAKDMFISGGENVYPAEVERVLMSHPCVAEAAVIGVPHVRWGEVGRAYVVCNQGMSVAREELLVLCESQLAKYKWPVEFIFDPEDLPRTPLGKIRKFLLRDKLKPEQG